MTEFSTTQHIINRIHCIFENKAIETTVKIKLIFDKKKYYIQKDSDSERQFEISLD